MGCSLIRVCCQTPHVNNQYLPLLQLSKKQLTVTKCVTFQEAEIYKKFSLRPQHFYDCVIINHNQDYFVTLPYLQSPPKEITPQLIGTAIIHYNKLYIKKRIVHNDIKLEHLKFYNDRLVIIDLGLAGSKGQPLNGAGSMLFSQTSSHEKDILELYIALCMLIFQNEEEQIQEQSKIWALIQLKVLPCFEDIKQYLKKGLVLWENTEIFSTKDNKINDIIQTFTACALEYYKQDEKVIE